MKKPAQKKKPFRLRVGMIGVRRDGVKTGPLMKTRGHDKITGSFPYQDSLTMLTWTKTGTYWAGGIQESPADILSEYKPKPRKRAKK